MFAASIRTAWVKPAIALALALMIGAGAARPAASASAGQISTRNIILGAVAVTAAVIVYNSYRHSQNTVVGHTQDGGQVYIDGRVVFPGGTVVYLSNDGRHRCDYYGDWPRCGAHARGFPWRYDDEDTWHGEGLHKGWDKGEGNKHHGDHDNQGDDDQGGHGGH